PHPVGWGGGPGASAVAGDDIRVVSHHISLDRSAVALAPAVLGSQLNHRLTEKLPLYAICFNLDPGCCQARCDWMQAGVRGCKHHHAVPAEHSLQRPIIEQSSRLL